MPRVLLVSIGSGELPAWQLGHWQVEYAHDEEDAFQQLASHGCDAAVLVADEPSSRVIDFCNLLEATCGSDLVPLLLGARGGNAAATTLLEVPAFDHFLDLDWSPALIERCLSLAVNRVRTGRAVAAIQQQVLRAIRDEVGQLKNLAIRDEVTGLYNYRHFREVVTREHERCSRHQRPYAVVFFDLDNLRELNNAHGHDAGTRALERVGLVLSTTTRSADFAFRLGGDEFVSLLVESDREAGRAYAERVCTALSQCALTIGGRRVIVSTSVGVAAYPCDGDTIDAVVARADAALYRAKSLGRNRIVVNGDEESSGGSARCSDSRTVS